MIAPGTISWSEFERRERALRGLLGRDAEEEEGGLFERLEEAGLDLEVLCVTERHPEPFAELAARAADLAAPRLAGMGQLRDGAFAAAAAERAAMQPGSVPGTAGHGRQYANGPLDTTRFGTSTLGLVYNEGRVDDLEYDPASGRLFAAASYGGVWMSEDLAGHWVEVNGDLPSTVVGSIAWSPIAGGRLIAVTGDGSFGGITGFPGFGVYYTDDIGDVAPADVHWTKAAGVPDGALGFKVAVDRSDPSKVYVATSKGLFRSTDGGATFVNAVLPTGPCAGVTDFQARPECTLANVVTDVVVQAPGGTTGVTDPIVVAAVGWRGGNHPNPDGTIQSPANGIYRSTDGGVTFHRATMTGFTPQDRIGRIELGEATGPDQDHDWLFAMVQDAQALDHAGCAVLDAPVDCSNGVDVAGLPVGSVNTVLDGVYASADFGDTWTQIATTETFQNPASGSALNGTAAALGYQPGVQAWYNMFVAPDPTLTDPATGAPRRLALGLEEVWENTDSGAPTGAPPLVPPIHPDTAFRVVGRYFAGQTCGFLDLGALVGFPVPVCPLNTQDPVVGGTTTHPDQHSAIWIPGEDGVSLIVGNDGGVYRQDVAAGGDLDNAAWGDGNVDGFQTLLPYFAAPARDGRVWFGLQDNGSGYIDPEEDLQPLQTFGGDGFFTAVDPKDSDIAYYETPGAAMAVTSDGGQTSSSVEPPAEGGPYRFSNPFIMDPNDALQLATGGSRIYVTDVGPATTTPVSGADPLPTDWHEVFDLGTNRTPGQRPDSLGEGEVLNQMTAIDIERNAVYVGFCGVCDILNADAPFQNGIATNVGGDRPPFSTSPDGWHIATAAGLPNRFITSIAIDPTDVRTIYVTLGGYSRKWAGPGTLQDRNPNVGQGHVFKSTDAGETFTDWSGNLPDVTANWVELRGDQLIVGTDVGAFASRSDGAPIYAPLEDIPPAPVFSIQMRPHDPNTAYLATFGRGVWEYRFADTRPTTEFRRLGGDDRVQTAVRVSQEQFPAADTVVIATAEDYADALAAVPLAAWNHAPILLTGSQALRPEVAAEIGRLGAHRALVIGGPRALSPAVEGALRSLGLEVTRYAGADRFETAARIAAALPVPEHVYLVEGAHPSPQRGWPDALAVGPLAAEQGRPILLTRAGDLPAATAQALSDLGVETVTVVGGPAAVSESVRDTLRDAGYTVREVGGADRYETSALLADLMEAANLTDHRVWLARGDNWPDALAAGASVAQNGGILLLSDRMHLESSAPTRQWLAEHSDDPTTVYLLGGTAALAPMVEVEARAVIAAGPPPPPPLPPLVGETLASFDFEDGPQGWTANGSGPADWQVRPPGDASAQAWRVEPYVPDYTATLTSPEIDQPGGATKVRFALAYNTEAGFDFVSVSWSAADGSSGQLFSASGVNDSWPDFDHFEAEFLAPPGPIKIVVKLSSDQLVTQVGAALDNVSIER